MKRGKERYTRITGPLIQYIGGEWVSSDRIPQGLQKAIVIAEDSDFITTAEFPLKASVQVLNTIANRDELFPGLTISQHH